MFSFFVNGGSISLHIPKQTPFSYGLGIKIIPSKNENNAVTICCHGYGGNNAIVAAVDSYRVLPGHLIGFNFPDYGITSESDHHKNVYGTIDEILPLLYVVKYCVCELTVPVINLYGFSAGGGAIVNALAILNQYSYKERLGQIGIFGNDVKRMITALEQGYIILDCPLKSMEEIMAFRMRPKLQIMAAHFAQNNMNPIDTLPLLSGLKLTVLLHFQNPDEILSNRDDLLFAQRLKEANGGITEVIISNDGGHNAYHAGLWERYKKLGFVDKSKN